MRHIVDSVYRLENLPVGDVHLIVGHHGLTLIDTGARGALPHIERELASQGFRLEDIRYVLITHGHHDHTGCTAELQRRSGAQVYCHAAEADIVRGAQPEPLADPRQVAGLFRLMRPFFRPQPLAGAHVTRELHDGDALDEVLPGLTVLATPGHTLGHVGYWWPQRRLLFCGDAVGRLFGRRLQEPFAPYTVDRQQARHSILKLAQLGVEILCPGHGGPYVGTAQAALDGLTAQLRLSTAR